MFVGLVCGAGVRDFARSCGVPAGGAKSRVACEGKAEQLALLTTQPRESRTLCSGYDSAQNVGNNCAQTTMLIVVLRSKTNHLPRLSSCSHGGCAQCSGARVRLALCAALCHRCVGLVLGLAKPGSTTKCRRTELGARTVRSRSSDKSRLAGL